MSAHDSKLIATGLLFSAFAVSAIASGCAATSHASYASTLGAPSRSREMLALIDKPGPVTLETIVSADWAVDMGGLVNLDDPRAKAAGITEHLEPIQIYFYALHHPTRGLYVVDTGVQKALRDDREKAAIRGIVARYMNMDKLTVRTALGDYLAKSKEPLRGVLLTHMHLDHVSGMPDVPHGTPILAGPGETTATSFVNLVVAPNIDRELADQAPIEEWAFQLDPDHRFAGIHDVFGDGSVWALYVPGHTIGSTAYVVRTPNGPVLLTGDTCHTAWGWNNDVEPGGFTADHAMNKSSLASLRALAREHPKMEIHLGHQPLTKAPSSP